jgi:alcohol dehydrogenase class IV
VLRLPREILFDENQVAAIGQVAAGPGKRALICTIQPGLYDAFAARVTTRLAALRVKSWRPSILRLPSRQRTGGSELD